MLIFGGVYFFLYLKEAFRLQAFFFSISGGRWWSLSFELGSFQRVRCSWYIRPRVSETFFKTCNKWRVGDFAVPKLSGPTSTLRAPTGGDLSVDWASRSAIPGDGSGLCTFSGWGSRGLRTGHFNSHVSGCEVKLVSPSTDFFPTSGEPHIFQHHFPPALILH